MSRKHTQGEHRGYIGQMCVSSTCDYIAYGDVRGYLGGFRTAERAHSAVVRDHAGCVAQGGGSDAEVWRWSDGWLPCDDYGDDE